MATGQVTKAAMGSGVQVIATPKLPTPAEEVLELAYQLKAELQLLDELAGEKLDAYCYPPPICEGNAKDIKELPPYFNELRIVLIHAMDKVVKNRERLHGFGG